VIKLKPDIRDITKRGLHYIAENGGHVIRYKPWLGDWFSFLYDHIMSKSIFPKKFGGDIETHYEILKEALDGVQGKRVLELATGSGSAVHFLDKDNRYTGTDISPGLLKQAVKRFREAGFQKTEFYVVSADELPFANNSFDLCLCILSLNFFSDAKKVFQETRRVLLQKGVLVCSVPVPERNSVQSTIRGRLYSEAELEKSLGDCGFRFEPLSRENGALLYFKAVKKS